ncbi:hypothetical protein BGX34_010684, partial [Mortierella sp. NVP85]
MLEEMIRIDQAGELGANWIYRGQYAVLGSDKKVGPLLQHMWDQEKHHLKVFDGIVSQFRVRPTALRPFWEVAGFALGAGTALMGKEAAMACTEAVETVIGGHYNDQLRELLKIDHPDIAELRKVVQQFRDDELEHLETAIEHDAQKEAPRMSQDQSRLQTDDRRLDESLPSYEEAIQHQHGRGPFSLNDQIQNSDGDAGESDDGQEEDKPRNEPVRGVGVQSPAAHAQQTLAQPTAPPSNIGAQQHYDSYPFRQFQHQGRQDHARLAASFNAPNVEPSAPPAPAASAPDEFAGAAGDFPPIPGTGAASTFPARPPFPGYPNTFSLGVPFPGSGGPGRPGPPGGFGFGGMYAPGGYFGPLPPSGYPDAAPYHPGFLPGGQPFMMRPPPMPGFPFHVPPPPTSSSHPHPRSPVPPTAPAMPTPHIPEQTMASMSSHPESEDEKKRIDQKPQIPPLPTSMPVPMAPSAPLRPSSPFVASAMPGASEVPEASVTPGTTATSMGFESFGTSSPLVSGSATEDRTETSRSMENAPASAPVSISEAHELINAQDISVAGFMQTPSGCESMDPILEDPYQLYRFFVAHNDRPSMHLLITGTHDEKQSTRENYVDGTVKVVYRTVKVNDFKIVLDLTPYITTSGTLKTLLNPETGKQPTLREVMEEHVKDWNYFKELHMEKKVTWDYAHLTRMITNAIRSINYKYTVEISYPITNHQVKVLSSSPMASFLRSELTGL